MLQELFIRIKCLTSRIKLKLLISFTHNVLNLWWIQEEAKDVPLLGPISFIFMQFSVKKCQIKGWHALVWGWCTPLRNPGSATVNLTANWWFQVMKHLHEYCMHNGYSQGQSSKSMNSCTGYYMVPLQFESIFIAYPASAERLQPLADMGYSLFYSSREYIPHTFLRMNRFV